GIAFITDQCARQGGGVTGVISLAVFSVRDLVEMQTDSTVDRIHQYKFANRDKTYVGYLCTPDEMGQLRGGFEQAWIVDRKFGRRRCERAGGHARPFGDRR